MNQGCSSSSSSSRLHLSQNQQDAFRYAREHLSREGPWSIVQAPRADKRLMACECLDLHRYFPFSWETPSSIITPPLPSRRLHILPSSLVFIFQDTVNITDACFALPFVQHQPCIWPRSLCCIASSEHISSFRCGSSLLDPSLIPLNSHHPPRSLTINCHWPLHLD